MSGRKGDATAMKIRYNSPTVLTFAFICTTVLLLDQTVLKGLTRNYFMVAGRGTFNLHSVHDWITLFTHIIGHADIQHLIGNFSLILLIGPILEATYGSPALFLMITVTSLVTGAFHALLFPSYLCGASGVVFMMILLASFTNINKGEVPLTFILILILYLGGEILNAFKEDNVSQFAHIVGGFIGSLFGFFKPAKKRGGKTVAYTEEGN
jgi:membrane associated rhomboid family serine protease